MPLHLLGKKSWNVYNSDNVARVRRDEADAQARQEAAEQRMQEEDAARRIAILRGESPPPPPPHSRIAPAEASAQPQRSNDDAAGGGSRGVKRRRIRGEDDTDRDIRLAKLDAEAGQRASRTLVQHREDDAPLHDHAGHIQLVAPPDEKPVRRAEKNADAEAEKSRKRKRDEDQYTMRFSNAAGFKNGMAKPWYASSATTAVVEAAPEQSSIEEKDVWAMQHAQRQLKQSEADREKWRKKRLAEVEDVKRTEERSRQRDRKKYPRRGDREGSLEGFQLDAPAERKRERGGEGDHRRRHHHHSSRRRYKNRSPSPDRQR